MFSLHKILILLFGVAISVHAVPPVLNYAGQVAVNGEAFDGNGLFKFALVNADGTTTYWSNDGTSVDGSEPQASVAVSVNGGLYSILLGNTAQQGMGAIDPAVFAQHTDAKLRVWFSDGVNGFQQLSPDRPFASVPYAFSAGTAQTAGSALIANGAVNLDMLSQDVKTQINAPISRSRLSQEVVADINATIGMNRLSSEVTEKLNQEKTTTNYNAPSVGSLLAVPSGSDAPAGYSLYQSGEPELELVWEEKAPVSVARKAYDGVEVLDGKIYFVGGHNGSSKNIAERYDPITNTWVTLSPMSTNRHGIASTVLNGKVYAIGGQGVASVEVYDPSTESWSAGVALPSEVNHGTAFTVGGKIYLIGGRNASDQNINQVLCFDPSTNQWQAKANMPTARNGAKLVWFENRIWAIGGYTSNSSNKVESYDPTTNSWQVEVSLTTARNWPVAWLANGKIFVASGNNGSSYLSSIEVYDPTTKQWANAGNFPENKYLGDAVVLNDRVYVIGGYNGSAYSNKVFAADLNASVEGVYDLYRKDGNAPVGTPIVQSEYADGSVTGSKMADGAVTASKIAKDSVGIWQLNPKVMKYLKPEITTQPQASTIYAGGDGSVSFSVEGKYLTYQWKKDGVDLAGETNATLKIKDANATLHDGNYSVVVSNDFGSVESDLVEVSVKDGILNGLVGWWKFDEGSGTVAYDSSGNENHGNLINGPTWTDGKLGGALSFDGDDYLITNANVNVQGNAPRAIAVWIKPSALNTNRAIVSLGLDSNNKTFEILAHGASAAIHLTNGTLAGGSLQINNWYSLCGSSDGQIIKLFVNGVLVNQENRILNTHLNNVLIGKARWGGIANAKGLIDDVRIYDRALSAEEVQDLYNLGQ